MPYGVAPLPLGYLDRDSQLTSIPDLPTSGYHRQPVFRKTNMTLKLLLQVKHATRPFKFHMEMDPLSGPIYSDSGNDQQVL